MYFIRTLSRRLASWIISLIIVAHLNRLQYYLEDLKGKSCFCGCFNLGCLYNYAFESKLKGIH